MGWMMFVSRQDAGRRLGFRLQELGVEVDVVAGLPRGGVVVAAEVAAILQRPLDVIVVRKIGHPWHREFAVGAIAEDGVLILDQDVIAAFPIDDRELEAVIAEEEGRLRQHCLKFHQDRKTHLAGRRVLLVDDGLATGATAEAAVLSARQKQAGRIIVAAPVASSGATERLRRVAGNVISCVTDPAFCAVGRYYQHFLPTTDEEVLALLRQQQADYGHAV